MPAQPAPGTLNVAAGETLPVIPRARALRAFGVVLLLFVLVVGAMLAIFAYQGKTVRDYGLQVLAAAPAGLSTATGCSVLAPRVIPPAQLSECRVTPLPGGKRRLDLTFEGGRTFRLER
jgi:hypothetical protein